MNPVHLAFIQNLRPLELIFLLVVVLLLFGAKRLPELFRSFGKSIKEFKKATSEIEDDVRSAMDVENAPKQSSHLEAEEAKTNTAASQTTSDNENTKPDQEV